MTFFKLIVYSYKKLVKIQLNWTTGMATNIKTIGIKAAAYDIIKAVSEERKNSTKPDGICDIATEAIEKAFGSKISKKTEV